MYKSMKAHSISQKNNYNIEVEFVKRSYYSTNDLSKFFDFKTFRPVKKIKILTALIYLNIAALYHYTCSLLLYVLANHVKKELIKKI